MLCAKKTENTSIRKADIWNFGSFTSLEEIKVGQRC